MRRYTSPMQINESHPIAKGARIKLDGLTYQGEPLSKYVKADHFGTIVRHRSQPNTYHVMISDGSGMIELVVPAENQI